MGQKASTIGDVYSYGILLLEMLTGRRPTDDMFKDGLNLHNYAKMALPNQVMDIIDPYVFAGDETAVAKEEDNDEGDGIETKTDYVNSEAYPRGREKMLICIVSMIEIALACSAESPSKRMDMNNVLNELHHIRGAFIGEGMNRTDQIQG